MVVKLDAHQTSLEPFGLPWSSCNAHRPDDGSGIRNGGRTRYFRVGASAPASPPGVLDVLKAGSSSSSGGGSTSSSNAGGRRTGLARIQIELQPCRPHATSSPSSDAHRTRPKPKKSNSAPVVLRRGTGDSQGNEESNDSTDVPSYPSLLIACSLKTRVPDAAEAAASVGDETGGRAFCFPREALATSTLPLRPTKRRRALHDVDGPGTGSLACKKRRLRLDLVTSRLSQPYSWPATHILNRESDDDSPMLSRFLKFTAIGLLKKAGHQTALVRKAAILNRVRIGVRQAAMLRGHTIIAGIAARGNSLSHGLQLVTTPHSSTGALFPGLAPRPYPMPPAWRPHTTAFHSSSPTLNPLDRCDSISNVTNMGNAILNPTTGTTRQPPMPRLDPPVRSSNLSSHVDEEDEIAFPSPDLETRYADLSDDDMDDVYADFGVLFGSGARSPEGGSARSEATGSEHFYEEYLDELDGIPWMA
ncbi:hypothetical protein GGR54DRAFT_303606 [Hypoxylon sp. NC1633]|nr:hypothetical protein GGR54DRAFT_303606 [Hypoxylon sp. NC1633]